MADELIVALAFDGRARVVVAETTGVVERLRAIHDTGPTLTAALGRLATGALLMAATLEKVTEREPVLTVKVEGDGPAGRLIATASPLGWVRAFAENPRAGAATRADGKLDVAAVVGRSGTLEVVRDPGIGVPYRGVVELVSGELAQDLAHYLTESEQLPAAVGLGVYVVPQGRVEHAGGFIVQALPGLGEEGTAELEERVRALGPVTRRLREGDSADDIVRALLPAGGRVLARRAVQFRCGCSEDRVERALKLLGAEEVKKVLAQARREPVFLTCHFCHRQYPASPRLLERLLRELEAEGRGR